MIAVGLIGFGLAGRYFHAPLITAAAMEVRAVVSSRKDEVRALLPQAAVLDSDTDLFARDDIELVVIASPNRLHAPQAAAALRAGKHVVVDKPLGIGASEARGLAQLAAERELELTVFQNRRWDSDFLTVRRLIAEGSLGDIGAFHARWDRFRPTVADRWRERAEAGGGVLFDLGSHLIDQTLQLFGRPDWLQADVFAQRPGAVIDDGFEILMGRGRLRISLGASSLAPDNAFRYRIHGTRASFTKSGLDPQEGQLRAGMNPLDAAFGMEPIEQSGTIVHGDGTRRSVTSERGRWLDFYQRVRDSVDGVAQVPVLASEATVTLEIIEAALESSRTGHRVELH